MAKEIIKPVSPKAGVRDRILAAADRLFREKGYVNTGVREVMKVAEVVPASFYDHFPSKPHLGAEYITLRKCKMISGLQSLAEKYPENPLKFLRSFCLYQKKLLNHGDFFGCEFAQLAYQFEGGGDVVHSALWNAEKEWKSFLIGYFSNFKDPVSAENLAEDIMLQIEGAFVLWKISGKKEYLDKLEDRLVRLL